MSGHTPGPWTVRDADTVVGPAGNVVAECCGYSERATDAEQRRQGGREANAALIASAPELLAALRLAHPLLIRLGDFIANREGRCDAVLAVANAIARAEGRQS